MRYNAGQRLSSRDDRGGEMKNLAQGIKSTTKQAQGRKSNIKEGGTKDFKLFEEGGEKFCGNASSC